MSVHRVLVVGCGAIGGLLAEAFSRGCEVAVLDLDRAHVAAIAANGLRIDGPAPGVVRHVTLRTTADASALVGQRFDAVVFAVKSQATAAAVATLAPVLAGAPALLSLQNGMGQEESLLAWPNVPVARGVTIDAGRFVEPGVVAHLIRGQQTYLGPVRGTLDDVAWMAQSLTAGGMPCEAVADPMPAIWSKFVFNSVMNPVGALLLGINRARYESADIRALIDDMAAECRGVVAALGGRFAFDPMDLVTKTRAGLLPVTRHAGSMALDIEQGRATEIDCLTGFVVHHGERLGLPVTACRTVYRLVKGLEIAAAARANAAAP